jgi:hypothetical protein
MKVVFGVNRVVFTTLLFCFISLNAMDPNPPVLQTKLTGLKTSLVQLKTKLGDLNKKLVALKDKLKISTPFVLPHQPSIQPVITQKIEVITQPPALLRTDLQQATQASAVVENVLGISESDLVKLSKNDPKKFENFLIKKQENGRDVYYLKNPDVPTAVEIRVGKYSEPTGEDLEKRVAVRKTQLVGQPKKKMSFSIVYQSAYDGKPFVDTGNMQADPAYKNALFMAASNFNGLETLRADEDVDYFGNKKWDVKPVDEYSGDHTQGPSVAIATVAGTIFRTYFRNCEKYPDKPEKWPQYVGDTDREANYLKNFGIPTRNGYVTSLSKDNIKQLSADDAFSKFMYGSQEGVQVTHTGLDYDKHKRFNDPTQKVSQIYVAALDIGQSSSPLTKKLSDSTEMFQILGVVKKILEMSYDAVIKEAFVQDIHTVVLTRIGGGVFGNPYGMIDAAIKGALVKNKEILEMGGINVVLNAYVTPEAEAMENLTKEYGGTITQFGNGQKITTTYTVPATE